MFLDSNPAFTKQIYGKQLVIKNKKKNIIIRVLFSRLNIRSVFVFDVIKWK